jgi:anthranilate synthase component I
MPNSIHPSYIEVKKISAEANLIPVYKEILADLETPVSTYLKLASGKPYAYLLESVEGGERWGRYSFISWEPKLIFESRGDKFSVHEPKQQPVWKNTRDPLEELRELLAEFKPSEARGLPRFWGGAVGYISYDMVRFFEKLGEKPKDTLNLPDSLFMLTDKMIIFDHLNHMIKIVVCLDVRDNGDLAAKYRAAEVEIAKIEKLLSKPLKAGKQQAKKPTAVLSSNVKKSEFKNGVAKIKEYIRAGDIIQAVLSQRFYKKTKATALDIYRRLRIINPSPYMYLLELGGFEIIGTSPEILVRKEGSLVETRPLAGTRKRGTNPEEESALEKELLSDPKERAEHVMLVDLGRNDLGRVSSPSTVRVNKLMQIEKYSHIMHIVSSVTGTLEPGTGPFETLRSVFPAGTVSGAPKIRAMQIIDEIEPTARGPYAGALGYFSYSDNMDMAITIRTIVLKNGIAYAQAGAGIVADSVPENEYHETKNKAAALFSAIAMAENDNGQ